jgi:hypothetical protein
MNLMPYNDRTCPVHGLGCPLLAMRHDVDADLVDLPPLNPGDDMWTLDADADSAVSWTRAEWAAHLASGPLRDLARPVLEARPGLVWIFAPSCSGTSMTYAPGFGEVLQ